jgi:hypothetical protein
MNIFFSTGSSFQKKIQNIDLGFFTFFLLGFDIHLFFLPKKEKKILLFEESICPLSVDQSFFLLYRILLFICPLLAQLFSLSSFSHVRETKCWPKRYIVVR